ncbi:alkaline shock response membrane anchor protein AmaP [Nocardia sp. alder85J]|uniref:alkaline shock response membrane anchor protein AmaP n=1 Tax=Nocardia sp. alder85J TaxID=2862949 RepID=UPI001CD3E494|nr:alkaline shock response membrane anchor protein AmaP [Nocardia sp. alder85J]MCX4093583.1 alkaline shock response membrane anchor protein AmaP [Nocardia sp. alder85J]
MSRTNRPAALNRAVLGFTGALLLAAGALAVAAHDGRVRWIHADDTLVPGTAAPPTWVLWAVGVAAVLLALLCLRWLSAQLFRMPKSVTWRTGSIEGAGTTVLESSTAAAPVATDIESYRGVRAASAWLAGERTAPELHLLVTAEPTADITELRRTILGHAVTRLCTALEVETMPVSLELDFAEDRKPARVR